MTFDGGIYIPNDPAVAPTLYEYYATLAPLPQPAPDDTDCATLTYTLDPNTQKVSLMRTGAAFGAGAAIGMVTSRAITPHVHLSYGQAAGAGLAGGLIAGLIIGAIEKSKEGEILPGPALDNQAEEKIKLLTANKVTLGELPPAGTADVATATPPQPAPTVPVTQVAASPAASGEAQPAPVPAPAAPAAPAAPVVPAAPAAAPVAATASAVSATSTTAVSADSMRSLAQNVATQMGCGAVKDYGDSGYVAPCGSNGVYIGCDAGQCRPLHTIKLEDNP